MFDPALLAVDLRALPAEPGIDFVRILGKAVRAAELGQLVGIRPPELPLALLEPIVAPAAAGLVKALEGGCQTAERVLEIVAEQDGKRQGVAGDGRTAPFAAPRETFAEAAFDLVFDDALEDAL